MADYQPLLGTPDRLEAFFRRVLPAHVDAATAQEVVSFVDDARTMVSTIRQFDRRIVGLAWLVRDGAETIHHLVAAMNAGHELAITHPDDPGAKAVLDAYDACVVDARRSAARIEPPRRGPDPCQGIGMVVESLDVEAGG
jgi:hypothetical protein